ncbi:MAG: hypothetical protein NC206_07045 [Bacteroides sp.]|nr:hypothetical protein [Roseburia sp.]MCM1346828.1 hypothetical protein [Bacteroides sp.]MCM1421358.1 hypothetical protein [Bacteroides sp.]
MRDFDLVEEDMDSVVGKMPVYIQRYVLGLCLFVVLVLCGGAFFIKYPEKLSGQMVVYANQNDVKYAFVYLTAKNIGELEEGQAVFLYPENYSEVDYGFLVGSVHSFSGTPNEQGLYVVKVRLDNSLTTSFNEKLSGNIQLEGKGEIVIRDRRLIQCLFGF